MSGPGESRAPIAFEPHGRRQFRSIVSVIARPLGAVQDAFIFNSIGNSGIRRVHERAPKILRSERSTFLL
jgi:hypothetical protein